MNGASGVNGESRNDHTPSLARGVALLNAGEHQAALEAASAACHAEPTRAEAHYLYGQCWAALGQQAQAERAFAEAVRLRPQWADAWVNYGVARYRQNAIDDAKTAMRHALRHTPGHAAATANLGAFMRISGEHEEAETLLDRAMALDPGAVGSRLNRAADLLQEERAADALEVLEDAPPPAQADQLRHWLLQKSLALLQLREVDSARMVLADFDALGNCPLALLPLRLWRDVLLAQAVGKPAAAEASAVQMGEALGQMGPHGLPEHRIMAHYDLAKFRSGRGEHARAFAHWTAGHRLLAASQPFSREEHLAIIEATRARFDAARFAYGPRAANRDPAPVFIVGMPRSGTTLCEQILAAHGQVYGAGERPTLRQAFAALGEGLGADAVGRVAARDARTLDWAAARYLAELHELAPDKLRIVDKMPSNYLYLGLVGAMLPSARIIHCRRDPRDIGLSIFTFRFYGQHSYAHDLADLGWTIGQQVRIMDHWKATLPNPVLTVDLADWVQDFDSTLSRVLSHLDLPYDPRCARFYEGESPARNPATTGTGPEGGCRCRCLRGLLTWR